MGMSLAPAPARYDPDDLVWLGEQLGGRVELDPWGNAIVSPTSDPHIAAVGRLAMALGRALDGTDALVANDGPAWRVPFGSGYTNQPDITVLPGPAIGRHPEHAWHLWPSPLLVVEVASPSTRAIDRTRKRQDYLRGGAQAYLLVDLPDLAPVDEPTLELWTPRGGDWATAAAGSAVVIDLLGRTVTLRLDT